MPIFTNGCLQIKKHEPFIYISRLSNLDNLLYIRDFIAHKKGCKNEYEGSTSNDKPSFPLLYHCFIPNKATSLLESK